VKADSGRRAIYSWESSGLLRIICDDDSPPAVKTLLPDGFIIFGAPCPDMT
jgi:hypothetical protein